MNPSDYLPPPAAADPIPRDPDDVDLTDPDPDDGVWKTIYRTRDPHTGRFHLTQKRNGSTRTVLEGGH